MPSTRWVEGRVFSVQLKDGSFVLAQMLASPYLAFFHLFREIDQWQDGDAEQAQLLFVCAVTRQFLHSSVVTPHKNVRPQCVPLVPSRSIKGFPGGREITIWKDTPEERELSLLQERPGGRLVDLYPAKGKFGDYAVIMNSIPLEDAETIDRYETTSIWTYPALNERLCLSKKAGKPVDPLKDLMFDRPPREEYKIFYDMMMSRGTLEDWGYHSPIHKRAPSKPAAKPTSDAKKKRS